MIYTVTFNPALDYIIKVPGYTEGMVNRTSEEKFLAGGKGLNVSVVLANLGVVNTALGFTAGFVGDIIEEMTNVPGLKCDFIRLGSGVSRINVKIKAEHETEINGRGPDIGDIELKVFYEKLDKLKDGDILVLAGSVPASMPKNVYCDIMEFLSNKHIRTVVDATGELLVSTLKYKPFLIKPNLAELEEIFKIKLFGDEAIIDCAKRLIGMGAENVIVSMGKDGAIMVTENGDVLRCAAPEGKRVNTTGAGDSMVAGFIAGYIEKNDYEYALGLGICAGSASTFSENLATGDEIRNLYEKLK